MRAFLSGLPIRRTISWIAMGLATAVGVTTDSSAAPPYKATGRCAGFPKISLQTQPGTCVGLVGSGLGFPRGLATHGEDIYITDLGSRLPGRGRLLRVRLDRPWKPTVVLSRLDRPGAIVSGADGYLYIAESRRIIRFNPDASDPPSTLETVLTGLPTDGLHNLPGLAMARDGGLFVSIGSASNNCEDGRGRRPPPNRPCQELTAKPPRGSILRLPANRQAAISSQSAEVYASGIRNALALVQLPNGVLLAASNARDNIDAADPRLSDDKLPHDLLLAVTAKSRHGWPYCFDIGRPSPEYPKAKCASFVRPARLLPPHSAPLSMLLYRGALGPGRGPKLIMAYHGYRAQGHRIVAFGTNQDGMPTGRSVDLVWGWQAARGVRPQGAPVAILALADGSMLILEDHNGTLLRLAPR
jgi:glucose/arabinose dehydrogenase